MSVQSGWLVGADEQDAGNMLVYRKKYAGPPLPTPARTAAPGSHQDVAAATEDGSDDAPQGATDPDATATAGATEAPGTPTLAAGSRGTLLSAASGSAELRPVGGRRSWALGTTAGR